MSYKRIALPQSATRNYANTLGLATGLFLLEATTLFTAKFFFDTDIGNTQNSERIGFVFDNSPVKESFLTYFYEIGLKNPFIEEVKFRLMPLLFAKATIYTINKKLFQGDIELPKQFTQSLKWTIGGLSTLLFSAAHDGFMSFPIQPLVSGAFSWYLMQEKGFIHAFLAHSTNNTLSLALKSWSEWMLDE